MVTIMMFVSTDRVTSINIIILLIFGALIFNFLWASFVVTAAAAAASLDVEERTLRSYSGKRNGAGVHNRAYP